MAKRTQEELARVSKLEQNFCHANTLALDIHTQIMDGYFKIRDERAFDGGPVVPSDYHLDASETILATLRRFKAYLDGERPTPENEG